MHLLYKSLPLVFPSRTLHQKCHLSRWHPSSLLLPMPAPLPTLPASCSSHEVPIAVSTQPWDDHLGSPFCTFITTLDPKGQSRRDVLFPHSNLLHPSSRYAYALYIQHTTGGTDGDDCSSVHLSLLLQLPCIGLAWLAWDVDLRSC